MARSPRAVRRVCALFALAALAPLSSFALQLKGAAVVFASAKEAREVLRTKDDFIERMSPFDRSARMKVARTVSEQEFLNFVTNSPLNWSEDERKRLSAIIDTIGKRLSDLAVPLPRRLLLFKTNGREEGNAAYTRANAIILPQREVAHWETSERLVCHELFHVISRLDPELRDRLYATIGFSKCPEAAIPPELQGRKITNPDAPRNDHFLRLTVDGKECVGVPILFSRTEKYDVVRGGEFFDYLQLEFLVAENVSDLSRTDVAASARKLVSLDQVSGFYQQVGRNTKYVIHPEEILAENFALLLQNGPAASPEIPAKIKAVLSQQRVSN